MVCCNFACDEYLLLCTFKWSLCYSKSGSELPGSSQNTISVLGHHLPSCQLHQMSWNPVILTMGFPDSLPFQKHSIVSRNFPGHLGHQLLLMYPCKPAFFHLPSVSIPHIPLTSRLMKRDEVWRRQLAPLLFSCCCYTQYGKLGGLIQHIYYLTAREVTSFSRLTSRCQQGSFLLKVLRGESVSWFLSASSDLLYSLACDLFLLVQNV